jgi:hypothetical protein
MMEARSGKMPTTSLLRLISRLSRSWGFLDQICRQCSTGKLEKAVMSGAASSRSRGDLGEAALELLGHPLKLAWTSSAEG